MAHICTTRSRSPQLVAPRAYDPTTHTFMISTRDCLFWPGRSAWVTSKWFRSSSRPQILSSARVNDSRVLRVSERVVIVVVVSYSVLRGRHRARPASGWRSTALELGHRRRDVARDPAHGDRRRDVHTAPRSPSPLRPCTCTWWRPGNDRHWEQDSLSCAETGNGRSVSAKAPKALGGDLLRRSKPDRFQRFGCRDASIRIDRGGVG